MRRLISLIFFILPFCLKATEVFYYSQETGEGGLRFALKDENDRWVEIGKDFSFLNSDFGAWGPGKKMYNPLLKRVGDIWNIIFAVNTPITVYGISESSDLIHWTPQEYYSSGELNVEDIGICIERKIGDSWIKGKLIDLDEGEINLLKAHAIDKTYLKNLYSEKATDDSHRFKGLQDINVSLIVSKKSKKISPLLLGVFFEDINYSADGGLYGELIQNRDFEYSSKENENIDWGPMFGWTTEGNNLIFQINQEHPISENNINYATISLNSFNPHDENGLLNSGFDGISLKKDELYKLSFWGRSKTVLHLKIELLNKNRQTIASSHITIRPSDKWEEYDCLFQAFDNYSDAVLKISPQSVGSVDLDMISLFPLNTFKRHHNGLRKDLAEAICNLKPKFVRFPGGCVAHGNGLDNIYDWKGSIGDLKDRKPIPNLWGYHQTRGLGYFEYFLFCEDIGAEPVPVLAAGVSCQNSDKPSRFSWNDVTLYGQQKGLPLDSMQSYIQDILDLIEYANGPLTSEWGSKRALAGHPEPFNLKYIGIGNEDLISDAFKVRFSMIQETIKKEHPEITLIGTTGPFYEGSDYDEGWNFAKLRNLDMVDEHYYVEPGWFIYNQDFYDSYDRDAPKVYLGEWAAHRPDRSSTMETALAEALYITALERNGDIVRMSSYAPLLAKKNHIHWRPDLIYFDNDSVYLTPDYHVFRLAAENAGDTYIESKLEINQENEKIKARIAASVVKDSETDVIIVKLVNMLPSTLNLNINLEELYSDFPLKDIKINIISMKGHPDQIDPDMQSQQFLGNSPLIHINLPAYSFSLLRFEEKFQPFSP